MNDLYISNYNGKPGYYESRNPGKSYNASTFRRCADVSAVGYRVRTFQMCLHVVGLVELFMTNVTCVRFLSSVNPNVPGQVMLQ